MKKVGDLPTLTYNRYKDQFLNPVRGMHFGKLSGFDDLCGKDIAIIGTPHINPIVYQLFAAILDVDFKPEDCKMEVQLIQRYGIRFPLNTYSHADLRDLHLFFLESELEQAIGRARPIRHPVRIKLLSSIPHPQACITKEEKIRGEQHLEQRRQNFMC